MSFSNRIKPMLPLRLGLAATYAYSGYSLFINPATWSSFVPSWFTNFLESYHLPLTTVLQAQGIVELCLAAIFFFWFLPNWLVKIAAFVSAIELALILWSGGLNLTVFRDLGILGASLAVFINYRE